jgi:hypothetical protein
MEQLNYDPIMQVNRCPSTTTDKYRFISSDQVATTIERDLGLKLVSIKNARCNKAERIGYQKHTLTFEEADKEYGLGEYKMRVCFINSHDGTSSYIVNISVERKVCMNGLHVGMPWATIRVRHTGDALNRVKEAIAELICKFPRVVAQIAKMRLTTLSPEQEVELAISAYAMRFNRNPLPEEIEQLLSWRRDVDRFNDAWTVFNRIQENITRGGIGYINKQNKSRQLRDLTNINKLFYINRALWAGTMELVA